MFKFDNSYRALPDRFYAAVAPTPVTTPRLIKLNRDLATELGLDAAALDGPAGAEIFSGNVLPDGGFPLAMVYAAHQFGTFVPKLGDGRAILLGEVIDAGGNRRDIQLKGAGRTPFSRRGDGRAALGPVLREYLVSEAMHALGIPTTRALAAVSTGEVVNRDTVLPGAVLTRVAASHIRIGTFQFFAATGDDEAVRNLADHVLDRHYQHVRAAENPYLALLEAYTERLAALVARWMQVGFIHGVMNTDNMAISGETIDYGPCAFLDAYNPAKAFSAIDQQGRYAYQNQPGIAQWNLARFAETLLPLLDADRETAIASANAALVTFGHHFQSHWLAGMSRKIGLLAQEDGDLDLVQEFLAILHEGEADFTLSFRTLADAASDSSADAEMRKLFVLPDLYDAWAMKWRARLSRETTDAIERRAVMRELNPAFIPRNHRIEQAIEAAIERDDFSLFEQLTVVLANPYEDQPGFVDYRQPPAPAERVIRTFCGT